MPPLAVSLPERFLLLSLNHEVSRQVVSLGISLASLLELAETGWITFDLSYQRVHLNRSSSHTSSVLNSILFHISHDEPRKVDELINFLSRIDFVEAFQNELIKKGLIEKTFISSLPDIDVSFRFPSDALIIPSDLGEVSWLREPPDAHISQTCSNLSYKRKETIQTYTLSEEGRRAVSETTLEMLMMVRSLAANVYGSERGLGDSDGPGLPLSTPSAAGAAAVPLTPSEKRPSSQTGAPKKGSKGEKAGASDKQGAAGAFQASTIPGLGITLSSPVTSLLPPPVKPVTLPTAVCPFFSEVPLGNPALLSSQTPPPSLVLFLRLLSSLDLLHLFLHPSDFVVHRTRLSFLLTSPASLVSQPPPEQLFSLPEAKSDGARPSSASFGEEGRSQVDDEFGEYGTEGSSPRSSKGGERPQSLRLPTPSALSTSQPPATPSKKTQQKPPTPSALASASGTGKGGKRDEKAGPAGKAGSGQDKEGDGKDKDDDLQAESYLHCFWNALETTLRPFPSFSNAMGLPTQ